MKTVPNGGIYLPVSLSPFYFSPSLFLSLYLLISLYYYFFHSLIIVSSCFFLYFVRSICISMYLSQGLPKDGTMEPLTWGCHYDAPFFKGYVETIKEMIEIEVLSLI